MFCIKYGAKCDAGSIKRKFMIVTKIARAAILIATSLSLAVLISLSAFAVEIIDYVFADDPPATSQSFGAIPGTVTISVEKIVVSTVTDVHLVVHNSTPERATLSRVYGSSANPSASGYAAMVVNGERLMTATYLSQYDPQTIDASESRSFAFSFRTVLEGDSIFDIEMSVRLPGSIYSSEQITIEGIDLSKAVESHHGSNTTTPPTPTITPTVTPTSGGTGASSQRAPIPLPAVLLMVFIFIVVPTG